MTAIDPTLIVVALVGAVPATIAAITAGRNASRTKETVRATKTTNGTNLGGIVERIEQKLDTHIANQKLHREATEEDPPAETEG